MIPDENKVEEKKVEEKKEPKKAVKHFKKVRVVKSKGESAVVEWVEDGKAFRKFVPLKLIKNQGVEEKELDKCPDYGVPWSKEIKPNLSSEDLEAALHNAGIWTAEDAVRNAGAVIGAINAAYKTDLGAILQAAKKHINKE